MNPSQASAILDAPTDRRGGCWSAALVGLTPQVVAGVAALLLVRVIGASLDKVVIAVEHHDLAGWFARLAGGYFGLCIMAAPMLIIIFAAANLGPQRGIGRVAALAAAVILSAGIGMVLRIVAADYFKFGNAWNRLDVYILYVWPRYAVLGGMLTVVGEFYRREMASIKAMQEAEVDRAAFERQMAEARLQVLQAQIEPHFLFNTLANVRRLCDKDPAAGRTMLEKLMRYLEVALPRMRDSESTLGRDAQLVEAFLHVQKIRMGQRLAYSIDIPLALRAHPVPPMMLLTLTENAIKHGLNPAPDGGQIRVAARVEDDRLILSVADTGVGFAPGSGVGTGLANVRARLAAQFGGNAALMLENNELGGVTATIVLPFPNAAETP